MIDRAGRTSVAEGIELYFSKRISAAVFVDRYLLCGVRSSDHGLKTMAQDAAVFFCDMQGYSNEDELPREAQRALDFLRSDESMWNYKAK